MTNGERRGWWSFGDGPTVGRVSRPSRPDWFARLVQLMVDGGGSDERIAGVVDARVEDDGGTEFGYRIWRRGERYRCASLDGRVHAIRGHGRLWLADGAGGVTSRRLSPQWMAPPEDYEFGTGRPDAERWDGDDFTVPTGAARRVEFLGRRAWEVELAPPPHKPFPMQMVVEEATGLILREGNAAFGTWHEWVELDTDAELPDELFTWSDDDRPAERFR